MGPTQPPQQPKQAHKRAIDQNHNITTKETIIMLPNDVLPKLIFFLFTISSIFPKSKSLASSTRALKLSMSLSCLHNITMHKHFQSKYKALLNHKYHTRQYFQQPGFVSLTFGPKKRVEKVEGSTPLPIDSSPLYLLCKIQQ